jgi:hypothetical protein
MTERATGTTKFITLYPAKERTDMAFQLLTTVALKVDLPAQKLRQGDVATIVDAHPGRPGQEPGYSSS